MASRLIRKLNWHPEQPAPEVFQVLSEFCAASEAEPENYGKGEFLQRFEAEVAELLGKESALFLPSGVMAQQIALRIAADTSKCHNIGFHPTTHVEVNEHRAYSQVHSLQGIPIGEKNKPILAADLDACPEALAALVVELPLRNLGGLLPTWYELNALTFAAHARGIARHLDGARLWESGVFYEREYRQICNLFDTVYVSFYKGLGGMAGAMLLGSAQFIAQARIWQRRLGGNLITMHPYVVSAKIGFDTRLRKMKVYYQRAVSLAAVLSQEPGIILRPQIPQNNMFHIFLNAPPEVLKKAKVAVAEEDGIDLFGKLFPADLPNWAGAEIVVGDNALDMTNEELVPLFRKVLEVAGN